LNWRDERRCSRGFDSHRALAVGLYAARYGLECPPAGAVYRVDVLEPLLEVFGEWNQSEKV
jgi:hypothetical protein